MTTLIQLRNLLKLMEVYDGHNDFKYEYKVEILEGVKTLYEFNSVNDFIDELPTNKDNYVIQELSIFTNSKTIEIRL